MLRRLRQPIVVVPVVIVAVMVGGWWIALRPSDDAGAASTTIRQLVEVTQGPMSETVSADGTVAAAQTDDLSFSSSGTVTAVNVKAGDTVTAGQVLATIDSASLQGDVASAEADVASAEAKLSDDQDASASDAQITADETSLASANDALTTAKESLAGASLVATFDGTVASVDLTVGEHLGSSGAGGTDATGSETGTGNSASSLPSSSSNGNGANGNDSSGSTAQIQVVSAGRYTVELSVDTSDISRIKVGQSASVTPSASGSSQSSGGGRFPGFLALGGFGGNNQSRSGATNGNGSTGSTGATGVTPGATSSTSATGTVTSVSKVADASSGVATYPVTITFDTTDAAFSVGTTVTGAVTVDQRENVVQVSSIAITTTNGVSTLQVAKDGTTTGPTETRTVTTGLVSDGNTEITQGLKAGEQVLVTITRPGAVTSGGNGNGGGGGGGFTPPQGGELRFGGPGTNG